MPDAKPHRNGRRDRVADVLLSVAAIAIALAACALYVEANVFDSARFADRAQAALEEPEVRAIVVEDIGDLVVNEVSEDAVAIRPLIDTLADAVIDTAAFQRLFRTAVLQLHDAAVEGNVDNAVLTVANVGIVLSQGLREIAPSIGDQIPETFDDALLEIANFKSVQGLTDAARLSHDLARYLSLLAVLLVVAAFACARNRVRALGRLGAALIASGALVIGAYYLGLYLATRAGVAPRFTDREAVRLVWETFMSDLVTVAVFMVGIGIVTSVVVEGALGGERVQSRARRAIKLAMQPESTRGRVAWSIGMIAVGTWFAFDPLGALRISLTLFGIFAVAVGMQELAILASPPDASRSGALAEESRRGRKRSVRLAAYVTMGAMLTLAVVGTIHAGGGIESLGLVRVADSCNGDRDLCERPFNEVAFASTHNSMADASSPNWLFPAQETPIDQQLADGIHGLMIDVYYAFPGRRVYTDTDRSSSKARSVMREEFGDQFVDSADRIRRSISKPSGVEPELFLCHGFCELGATKLDEAIEAIRVYLEKNPREVVLVVFEDYVPWQDLSASLRRGGLEKYAFDGPWGPKWPTLGEMIGDGKRLVLMTEKAEPRIDWMHNAYQVMQETPFHFPSISDLRDPDSCLELRGEPENTIFLVNHWVDTAPNPRPSIARRVNAKSFLADRVKRCEKKRGLPAGPISVDFYRQGDLLTVVDELNSSRD